MSVGCGGYHDGVRIGRCYQVVILWICDMSESIVCIAACGETRGRANWYRVEMVGAGDITMASYDSDYLMEM